MNIYHLSYKDNNNTNSLLKGVNILAKSFIQAIFIFERKYPNVEIQGIILSDLKPEDCNNYLSLNEEK